MTWFKVDGGKPSHPKFIRAAAEGTQAVALWDSAGACCASVDSDGFVDPAMLEHYASLPRVPDARAAARTLVRVGLWHDSKTIKDCPKCMSVTEGKLKRGWFYFHDWTDYQLSKAGKDDPIERKRAPREGEITDG